MAMHNLPELKPKFHGKYRGIVAVGKDPEGKGRIKVKVPALFGFKTLENWAYPVLPPQFVGTDLGDGRMKLVLDSTTQNTATLVGITEAGQTSIPSTLHASKITAQNSEIIRTKMTQIIAVDPSQWEIPVGTGVWVEFEGGDPDKPIWTGFWK